MSDTLIKLEHVNMYYEYGKESQYQALHDISLEIERGEYAAFFGPSGCGKTSMLYAISGIDHIQSGKIWVNDRELSKMTNQELAVYRQAGIGIIFQQFNLVPSLNVLQNVSLPMSFVGISRDRADLEAAKILDRLGLKQYAARYPFELSGGQQQRVGIARALANNPPLIVADEPLGNLDSVNAKNVLTFLRELHEKDGRTIIMVTHEAWSLQDTTKIFHMKDGVITSTEAHTPDVPEEKKPEGGGTSNKSAAESIESIDTAVRVISAAVLRGYSIAEIERFEEFLRERLGNKLDAAKFAELLVTPYLSGGLGLWKTKAERIAQRIEHVIEKRHDVSAIFEHLEKDPELPIRDEVFEIRNYVAAAYKDRLTPYTSAALDELIADRMRNYITQEDFISVLHRDVDQSGAGFGLRSAQKMADRLESVISGTHV